jgi:hypothetical protein
MSDDPRDFPMVMGRHGPRYADSWEVEEMEARRKEAESVRLRVTITFEYDADPAGYGTDDPAEMGKIDEENFRKDPLGMLEVFLEDRTADIEITGA